MKEKNSRQTLCQFNHFMLKDVKVTPRKKGNTTCLCVAAGVWNVFHSNVDVTCLGMTTLDHGPCDLCKGSMGNLNLPLGPTGFPRCGLRGGAVSIFCARGYKAVTISYCLFDFFTVCLETASVTMHWLKEIACSRAKIIML